MKEFKQCGAYGLILENDNILLVKKNGGPYDGKLDLPGGTIEFCEKPEEAMIRELFEEVGIDVETFKLFDADSVSFEWRFKEDLLLKVHHVGIFYKIDKYKNKVQSEMKIDDKNNDSLGASFYKILDLKKDELSKIAIMELEKLGYKLN